MSQNIALPAVDEVQVTIIVDNSLDILMASTDVARRFPQLPNTVSQRLSESNKVITLELFCMIPASVQKAHSIT
jgi:hypothetical protein